MEIVINIENDIGEWKIINNNIVKEDEKNG